MRVFYSTLQKKHRITEELYYGKVTAYGDSIERVSNITKSLKKEKIFDFVKPELCPYEAILAVHDKNYLQFLEMTQSLKAKEFVAPYVFPYDARLQKQNPIMPYRAGHFTFDSGAPIMKHTWEAACASASNSYASAQYLERTGEASYALCRPPGHHATANMYGGYCYLNNAAIAAKHLTQYGKVMIIDFDYHHGNGSQSIFYDSSDVFYLSLHAHPLVEFPFYSGFLEEHGIDEGFNYNLNVPLMPKTSSKEYFKNFEKSLNFALKVMDPDYIVVSAGFDIQSKDPLGHFNMLEKDFYKLGKMLKTLNKKMMFVQEGGYLLKSLGKNVESFLKGYMM